jgi:hypothetical protein
VKHGKLARTGPRKRRSLRLCLLSLPLLGILGAADAGGADEAEPAADLRREFTLRNGFVRGYVRIPSMPSGPKPAILQPLLDEERLLERGFAVVRFHTNWAAFRALAAAIPPQVPSKRPPSPDTAVGKLLLASPRPGVIGRSYFTLIAIDAASSIPTVLDHLEALPEIDPRRIGIAGSSTTGFVALEALLHDTRLSAAVVRVACGDYHAFLKSSSLALAGEKRWLPQGELVLDADYDAKLSAREPIRFPGAYPPRAVLMLNGALDPIVPADCAVHTAQALEKSYAGAGVAERFRFVLYGDRGHDLGPVAAGEILRWWERWLGGGD